MSPLQSPLHHQTQTVAWFIPTAKTTPTIIHSVRRFPHTMRPVGPHPIDVIPRTVAQQRILATWESNGPGPRAWVFAAAESCANWQRLNNNANLTFGGDQQTAGELFRKTGRLFGHKGGRAGYYPVAELLHLPHKTVPPPLVNQLAIAATEGVGSAEKIKRYLFLESLKIDAVKTVVLKCDYHPIRHDLSAQLAHVKPWLFALLKARRRTEELGVLARFDIVLCTNLTFNATYGDLSCEQSPEPWQPLLLGDKLWMCAPAQSGDIRLGSDLIALALSNGFASSSRFTVRDTEDLVRLARCTPEHLPELLRALESEAQPPDSLDLQTVTTPSRNLFYQEPVIPPAPPQPVITNTPEPTDTPPGSLHIQTIRSAPAPTVGNARPTPTPGPLQIMEAARRNAFDLLDGILPEGRRRVGTEEKHARSLLSDQEVAQALFTAATSRRLVAKGVFRLLRAVHWCEENGVSITLPGWWAGARAEVQAMEKTRCSEAEEE